MPIGTPLHERTFPLCESLNYREWSGYYTVSAYESHHEHEYNAIRNAAALIDVSPLFKCMVTGPDAARLVDRLITRDVSKMTVGQVFYTPWCDEHGKVIDDGTVSRLGDETFRWTAADAEPAVVPAERPRDERPDRGRVGRDRRGRAAGADVREAAARGGEGGDRSPEVFPRDQRHHRRRARRHLAHRVYGDLGYEIWMPAARALDVWDALMEGGRPFDIKPAGMLALDVARIEAGLLLIEVDFFSSRKAMIASQMYTPTSSGWAAW